MPRTRATKSAGASWYMNCGASPGSGPVCAPVARMDPAKRRADYDAHAPFGGQFKRGCGDGLVQEVESPPDQHRLEYVRLDSAGDCARVGASDADVSDQVLHPWPSAAPRRLRRGLHTCSQCSSWIS